MGTAVLPKYVSSGPTVVAQVSVEVKQWNCNVTRRCREANKGSNPPEKLGCGGTSGRSCVSDDINLVFVNLLYNLRFLPLTQTQIGSRPAFDLHPVQMEPDPFGSSCGKDRPPG